LSCNFVKLFELRTYAPNFLHKLFSSFDVLVFNHGAVLLLANIITSNDKVVAFGFSCKNLSSFAKYLSLITLVVGTDFVSAVSLAD